MPRDTSHEQHAWLLKRNCSLAPYQLALAYGVLCLMSFAVAVAFALNGFWYVPLFSILEMSAVALALLYYARHAADYEYIALLGDCLLVEQVLAGQVRQTRFDRYRTRIVLPRRARDLILLQAKGVSLAVGCFATEARRRQVAEELQQRLPRLRY